MMKKGTTEPDSISPTTVHKFDKNLIIHKPVSASATTDFGKVENKLSILEYICTIRQLHCE